MGRKQRRVKAVAVADGQHADPRIPLQDDSPVIAEGVPRPALAHIGKPGPVGHRFPDLSGGMIRIVEYEAPSHPDRIKEHVLSRFEGGRRGHVAEARLNPRCQKLFPEVPEAPALQVHLFPAVLGEVGEGVPDLDHILRLFQLGNQPLRLLRPEADAVQTGVELQRDRDLSPGLSRRFPQDRKLAEAAEGQKQAVFHRRFHLGVQWQTHDQNLLLQARFAQLDALRHLGDRKRVDPAEVGDDTAQRHRAQAVGVAFQNRDQLCPRFNLAAELFNVFFYRLQINLQIGITRDHASVFLFCRIGERRLRAPLTGSP